MKKNLKLFFVKKYIMAASARDALRKERITAPDDVWIDEEWKKGQADKLSIAIGFNTKK